MAETIRNDSILLLRFALGIIFIAHGSQKLLGWFGGYGFDATLQFFQQALGIPPALGVLAILAEFFGGLMVLLGVFTRLGAAAIAIDMAVALFKVHLSQGFFIAGDKVGFEYVFALLMIALYLVITGAGSLSLDARIREKVKGSAVERLL
jgi:putative oxidoreductase